MRLLSLAAIFLLALPALAQEPKPLEAARAKNAKLEAEQTELAATIARLNERQADVRKGIERANATRERIEKWYRPGTPDYDRPSKNEVLLTLDRLEEQTAPSEFQRTIDALTGQRSGFEERRSAIDNELADLDALRARLGATGEAVAAERETRLTRLREKYTEALKESSLLIELTTTRHRVLRGAFLQLRQENLLLRGRSDLTWEAIREAGADAKRLPSWLGGAARAVGGYIADGAHLPALLQLAGLVILAFVVFFLCGRSLRKRRAAIARDKKVQRRLIGLAEGVLHPLGVALTVFLVPYGAALLLPSLPANVRGYLEALAWVVGGFWLLRTIAARLMQTRTDGDGEPLLPPAGARQLALGIRLVMWLSLVLLPVLLALDHLGYENSGAREGLWLVYKALLGLVLIMVLLRKRFVESMLPQEPTGSAKLLSAAVRYLRPVAVLLVPALLIIDALRYDILARLITRFSIAAVIALIVGAVLYRGARSLLDAWLKRAYASDPDEKRDAAIGALHFSLRVVTVVLVVGGFLRLAGSDLAEMRSFFDHPLPLQKDAESPRTWWNVLVAFIVFYVFLKATTPARRALRELVLGKTSMEPGLRYSVSTLAGYLVFGTGIYFAMQQILDLSGFGYLVAALSVGLGFGLQEIVSNFVSGLILLFERPLKVGDLVQVGDKEGIVRRINIRATTVQTQDNIYLLVPNREFITQTVVNFAHDDPKMRIHVGVGVSYSSDTTLVRETLEAVAAASKNVLKHPKPSIRFLRFGDSSLDFEMLAWIARPPQKYEIGSELCFEIFEAFNKAGIQIPFPQRDLHVKSIVPASVAAAAKAADDAAGTQDPPAT